MGHSEEITAVKIAPDGKTIVSVSADGAILRWRFPVMDQEPHLSSSGEQRMEEGDGTIRLQE